MNGTHITTLFLREDLSPHLGLCDRLLGEFACSGAHKVDHQLLGSQGDLEVGNPVQKKTADLKLKENPDII